MSVVFLLMDCTNQLLREISCKECKRFDIAVTYRLAMLTEQHGGEKTDWTTVNKAIMERWSRSGLEWIKRKAHKGDFAKKQGSQS
jgi:hypothetical protein